MKNVLFKKMLLVLGLVFTGPMLNGATTRYDLSSLEERLKGIGCIVEYAPGGGVTALEEACGKINPLLAVLLEAQELRLKTFKALLADGELAFVKMCNNEMTCKIGTFYAEVRTMSDLYRGFLKRLQGIFEDCIVTTPVSNIQLVARQLASLSIVSFAIARTIWEAISVAYPERVQAIVSHDRVYGRLFVRIEKSLSDIIMACEGADGLTREVVTSSYAILPEAELSNFLELQTKNFRFLLALRKLLKCIRCDKRIINAQICNEARRMKLYVKPLQTAGVAAAGGPAEEEDDDVALLEKGIAGTKIDVLIE